MRTRKSRRGSIGRLRSHENFRTPEDIIEMWTETVPPVNYLVPSDLLAELTNEIAAATMKSANWGLLWGETPGEEESSPQECTVDLTAGDIAGIEGTPISSPTLEQLGELEIPE